MSSTIEDVVKSLVEFESALDTAKADASESKKKLLKDADDLSENAKSEAMARAQQIASERMSKARAEAEGEAESIKRKGDAELKKFEATISKRKNEAVELVAATLLGERA